MNKERQIFKLAEACGWDELWETEYQGWRGRNPNGMGDDFIPNYFNDLNALQEVYKILTHSQKITYGRHLQEIVGVGLVGYISNYPDDFAGLADITHATPEQKSEALLRTVNLWEE